MLWVGLAVSSASLRLCVWEPGQNHNLKSVTGQDDVCHSSPCLQKVSGCPEDRCKPSSIRDLHSPKKNTPPLYASLKKFVFLIFSKTSSVGALLLM